MTGEAQIEIVMTSVTRPSSQCVGSDGGISSSSAQMLSPGTEYIENDSPDETT